MRHTKYPLLLLCAAALAGCVFEKLEDCYTTINFSYKGDGDTEIFTDKLDRVDLYIFDNDQWLVEGFDHYQLTPAEIAAQSVKLFLPTGRSYQAVVIGNMHRGAVNDLRNGNVFDSKVMHPVTHPDIATGNQRIDTHDHLYGGDVGLEIPPTAGTTHTINLASRHVDMIVEVVGFDEYAEKYAERYGTRQGSLALELEHRGLPAYTEFSGSLPPESEWISQYPLSRRVAAERMYTHEYQVMRDVKGSTIHLSNGTEEIFSLDVEEFVQEKLMPDPDFPGPYDENGKLLHEAYIPIRIEIIDPGGSGFNNVEFNVTIPDWVLKDVTPEF